VPTRLPLPSIYSSGLSAGEQERKSSDAGWRSVGGNFALGERFAAAHIDSMPQFYGQIVTSLMQRAAILFEVTILKRTGKV
jgi:hypothetical protein